MVKTLGEGSYIDAGPFQLSLAALHIRMPKHVDDLSHLGEGEMHHWFSEGIIGALPDAEQEASSAVYGNSVGGTAIELALSSQPRPKSDIEEVKQTMTIKRGPLGGGSGTGYVFEASALRDREGNVSSPSIALTIERYIHLAESLEALGLTMDDIKRINPSSPDVHTISERIHGRDMSRKLLSRFGISIPILEHIPKGSLTKTDSQS